MSDPIAEAEQKRLDLVHNEQTKLTATFINGFAIAIYAVGGFAPFVGAVTSGATQASVPLVVMMAVCPGAAFGLHIMARRTIRRMR